jgi:cytochrome P450
MTDRLPPGPPARFFTGHLHELRTDLLGLYARCARDYGPVALLRFGFRRVWVITEPDLIEQILTSRKFTKHYALRMNRMLLGDGLLTSEGDAWLRQRRLIQPAFLRERLERYAVAFVEHAEQWSRTWRPNQEIEAHSEMRQLTLRIAARTLFGGDVQAEGLAVARALADVGDAFMRRLFSIFRVPESWPTPANIRAWRAIRRLDEIVYGLINQRRADKSERDDLLSLLLRARDAEDGKGMTDKQLRDEAMTLFLAGHETTALALTWTLDLLAGHPDVQGRLAAELREVLGDREPTNADLPRLRFAEMVVTESMRLRPPAYVVGRQAAEAVEVGGYVIPKGGTVIMPQYVVHRDPRFYAEPERFDPTRWAGGLRERIPKYAYYPFGGGPRICIGNTFAMMEAVLVLASLCRRWRFVKESAAPVKFRPRMTLAPAAPVTLRVESA